MEKVVRVRPLHERGSDLRYWLSRPIEERIAAVEALRQQYYRDMPDAEQRLQRVCRVTSLKQR